MKTFIYRLLSISSVLFVIIIALELIAFAFPNEYSFKRKYVEKSGDKIKVLVLGHSHTAHGIDPMAIGDSVFNMAISGRVHYYDAQLAERYIPTLKNLKCVIWPIGYNFGYLSYLYDVTENKISNGLRIRKLSPLECWRLMGVKDEDFNKGSKNQNDSSLYHLAGDSIVVNVLMAIFKELF